MSGRARNSQFKFTIPDASNIISTGISNNIQQTFSKILSSHKSPVVNCILISKKNQTKLWIWSLNSFILFNFSILDHFFSISSFCCVHRMCSESHLIVLKKSPEDFFEIISWIICSPKWDYANLLNTFRTPWCYVLPSTS